MVGGAGRAAVQRWQGWQREREARDRQQQIDELMGRNRQAKKALRIYGEMKQVREAAQRRTIISNALRSMSLRDIAGLRAEEAGELYRNWWRSLELSRPYSLERTLARAGRLSLVGPSTQQVTDSLLNRYHTFKNKLVAMEEFKMSGSDSAELRRRSDALKAALAKIEMVGTMSEQDYIKKLELGRTIATQIMNASLPPRNLASIIDIAVSRIPALREDLRKGNITDIRQLVGRNNVEKLERTIELLYSFNPIIGDVAWRQKGLVDSLVVQADQGKLPRVDAAFTILFGRSSYANMLKVYRTMVRSTYSLLAGSDLVL